MSNKTFRVEQIDHVELYVSEQYEAARWYSNVFGLEIMPEFEHWASTGPLMLTSNNGGTMIALFNGEPPYDRPLVGHYRVAFRVDGEGFLTFLQRAGSLDLSNHNGENVNGESYVDHDKAWSIYFNDPYGNRFEITTYDYDHVKANL